MVATIEEQQFRQMNNVGLPFPLCFVRTGAAVLAGATRNVIVFIKWV